ncbi:MAG: hypothetical protein HRT81_11645 [Henriciella sp.]|nr:hypothetical protein [Henriciella sp.]
MWFGRSTSTELYERAFDQFMIDVKFYAGEVRTYFVDLTLEERLLALCAFILVLIWVIVSRARRKYNPGSLSRQFGTAILVLAVVMLGGNLLFGGGAGAYAGLFSI